MINSKSKRIKKLVVPEYTADKELVMLPINLAGGNVLPDEFKEFLPIVKKMIQASPVKEGTAYLTIHTKHIEPAETHRRGGAHIDGNYNVSPEWKTPDRGGWKVGEGGRSISSEDHKNHIVVIPVAC